VHLGKFPAHKIIAFGGEILLLLLTCFPPITSYYWPSVFTTTQGTAKQWISNIKLNKRESQ
jgi:hypothetical protein